MLKIFPQKYSLYPKNPGSSKPPSFINFKNIYTFQNFYDYSSSNYSQNLHFFATKLFQKIWKTPVYPKTPFSNLGR